MVITIDLDKPCAECGKGGALPSGICLGCVVRVQQGKPMKSAQGKAFKAHYERNVMKR